MIATELFDLFDAHFWGWKGKEFGLSSLVQHADVCVILPAFCRFMPAPTREFGAPTREFGASVFVLACYKKN